MNDVKDHNVNDILAFSGMGSIMAKKDGKVTGFIFRCGNYGQKLLSYPGAKKVGHQNYHVPISSEEFQENGPGHYFLTILEDAMEVYEWMHPREFSKIVDYDRDLLVLRVGSITMIAKDAEKQKYRLTESGYFLTTDFEFFSVPKEEWLANIGRDML